MFRYFFILFSICGAFALPATQAAGLSKSETRFVYVDANGKVQSTEVISQFTGKMRYPFPHLDPKLARAATIAEERAHAHSRSRCWRYVKEALLAAGAVDSYPKTALARQAGDELVQPLRIQASPGARSVSGSDWLGLGLWVGPCRGPRGNSHCPWVCERFPCINAFAPTAYWRLRQELVIVGRLVRFLRSPISRIA